MAKKGAFLISREIFDNPIWTDVTKFRIFFYIVGNAVFSNEGVRVGNIVVKRGQLLKSYRNLADELYYVENRKVKKYSISVISRKIESLVKEERLKIESTELGTLFTVINYDEYQHLTNYKNEFGTVLEQCWNNDGTVLEQKRNNNKNDNNVNKNNTRKQVYEDDSIYIMLAKYFVEQIKQNNPNFKEPNYQKWADDIRLMIERDNRTEEQIKYLMKWVQQDDFEMANVLSPSKLRKRFDQLVLKVKAQKQKNKAEHSIPTRTEIDFNEGEDWH